VTVTSGKGQFHSFSNTRDNQDTRHWLCFVSSKHRWRRCDCPSRLICFTIPSFKALSLFCRICLRSKSEAKSKSIPVTGRGGLQGCKMIRIPHCLANLLTDGGKVVSPTQRPMLYSPETLFLCFWYSFLLEASKPQGLVQPEELGKLIKIIHLIGSRIRDLLYAVK
jgi:hypothetical protein